MQFVLVFFLSILGQVLIAQDAVVSLLRSSCTGQCPVYEIEFYETGKVSYRGIRYVHRLGLYQAQLPPSKIEQLVQQAKQIHYFEMATKYPIQDREELFDFPLCRTMVSDGKKVKYIFNRNNAPRELTDFEQRIESLIKDLKWTKIQSNIEQTLSKNKK